MEPVPQLAKRYHERALERADERYQEREDRRTRTVHIEPPKPVIVTVPVPQLQKRYRDRRAV